LVANNVASCIREEVKAGMFGRPQIVFFLAPFMQSIMWGSPYKAQYGHLARTFGEVIIDDSRV
jgi:hypothetical protein